MTWVTAARIPGRGDRRGAEGLLYDPTRVTHPDPVTAQASGSLSPKALAPFFSLLALFHVVAIGTRFDFVALFVPDVVASAILLAHFPLLLVAGWFEGRIDYGESSVDLPMWMRINSKPVRLAFTFAFTYLGIVVLQTWDISIGPIDPSPPTDWPLGQRAMWFGMMSAGMFFPNYLAAAGALIPVLRAITTPFRRLPAVVALVLLSIVGTGLGFGAVILLSNQPVASGIGAVQAFLDAPAIAVGMAFGMVWVPVIWGLITGRGE